MDSGIGTNQSYHVTLTAPQADRRNGTENPVLALFSLVDAVSIATPELCQAGHYPSQEKHAEREHPRNAPGTRLIPLTQGLFAVVDEADYPKVAGRKWHACRNHRDKSWYAVRSVTLPAGNRSKVFMHRAIMQIPGFIDHHDLNGLNNTRQNLRPATCAENNRNIGKPRHGVTSKFKGVCYHPKGRKYQATVRYEGKNIYLGLFKTEEEAAYTYDREARRRFGFFARTNFPLPPMVIPQRATPCQ